VLPTTPAPPRRTARISARDPGATRAWLRGLLGRTTRIAASARARRAVRFKLTVCRLRVDMPPHVGDVRTRFAPGRGRALSEWPCAPYATCTHAQRGTARNSARDLARTARGRDGRGEAGEGARSRGSWNLQRNDGAALDTALACRTRGPNATCVRLRGLLGRTTQIAASARARCALTAAAGTRAERASRGQVPLERNRSTPADFTGVMYQAFTVGPFSERRSTRCNALGNPGKKNSKLASPPGIADCTP
jgi:hypothetical protein